MLQFNIDWYRSTRQQFIFTSTANSALHSSRGRGVLVPHTDSCSVIRSAGISQIDGHVGAAAFIVDCGSPQSMYTAVIPMQYVGMPAVENCGTHSCCVPLPLRGEVFVCGGFDGYNMTIHDTKNIGASCIQIKSSEIALLFC